MVFPQDIVDRNLTISELEIYNILIALRTFEDKLKNCTLHIRTDNAASVVMLQTGRGKCRAMLDCARQIWALAATNNISFKVSHIVGRNNIVADVLSRAHLNENYSKKLDRLIEEYNPVLMEVKRKHLTLQD